jgi:predicted enzyme related to lactoylglutathione lyase
MANRFGGDILIQSPDPKKAAAFYVQQLGFEITAEEPMIELKGPKINLYIEKGPALGPILEVFVPDVGEARKKLVASGCVVVKDEPEFPRVYVRDPMGLIYNLNEG